MEEIHKRYNKPVIICYNAILRDLITEESTRYNYILREDYLDIQVEKLQKQWDYISTHDYIYGAVWWCLFDYKLHRGIGEDLISPWGVFTRDRKPKPVYYLMKKLYSAVPTFKAVGN